MKLCPSDIPCREGMLPNYATPKVYRGELTLMHEWFYGGQWNACNPLVCRECQRNAMACNDDKPMA